MGLTEIEKYNHLKFHFKEIMDKNAFLFQVLSLSFQDNQPVKQEGLPDILFVLDSVGTCISSRFRRDF
jgi:hypothetical protein